MFHWFAHNHPDQIHRFVDSLSPNQIESKNQMFLGLMTSGIVIPQDSNGGVNIEIVGGWFGWPLIGMILQRFAVVNRIDFFEIDPFCCDVLRKYVDVFAPDVKINIYNMNWFDYKEERRSHIVINTSCEHMPDLYTQRKYLIEPKGTGTLLMLTSNDKEDEPDHINCKSTATQLGEDNKLSLLYGDSFKMESWINENEYTTYNRHIAIGKWKSY